MAWNPNSSPWEIWDSEGAFTTGHGHSPNSDLQNEPISNNNSISSDTATTLCLDGYGVSSQRSKVLEVKTSIVVSALADKKDDQDSEASGGVAFPNGSRIPIVTTCIGAIEYLATSNKIGHNIGNETQGPFHDNWAEIGCCPSLKIMPASNFVNHIDNLNSDYDDDDGGGGGGGGGVKMVDLMLDAEEQGLPYRLDAHDVDDVVDECKGFIHGDDVDADADADDVVNEFESSYRQDASPGSEGLLTSLHLGKMKDVYPRWDLKLSPNPNVGKNLNLSPNLRGSCKPKIGLAGPQAPPCCQVQGCKLDLSSAKDYHRRHRVCEAHSKAVKVVVSSLEQRFCQQCSRFHVLAEFDEAKRSCRRRLAGHNKRRRKPQPDPLQFTFEECKHDLLQQHPRFPQMSLWKDGWDYHANMMRLRHEDNHPVHPLHYSHLMQTPSIERKECIDDLSPSIHHDKLPLLFQNPKAIEEAGVSYAKDQHHHHCPLHHQRHQENEPHHHHHDLSDPVTNGQTVSSSSSSWPSSLFSLSQFGNCSFSATEITPVKTTPVQPRVNDSGRALSLLSLQTHGTTHGAISPHHPRPHHQALHWNHHEDMAPHQHWHDLCVEHVVVRSTALSSDMHSSEDTELKKDGYECSYMHNDEGLERSDRQSTRSLAMQGYGKMKRTRDLM